MRALSICFLALLLITSQVFAEASVKSSGLSWTELSDDFPDETNTRFGKLTLRNSLGEDIAKNEVLLAGKSLYKGDEYTYSHVYKVFERSDSDVVLIGNNCGGSACASDQLIFAILKKATAPKLIQNDFLDAYPHEIKFNQAGDTLTFNLGYSEAKLKIAVLNGDNTLKTHLETLAPQALSEENCKWLYEDAIEACISARSDDAKCADPIAGFTGVYMRGVAAMSDYPGYKSEGFDKQCKQACKTGKSPDYSSFGVAVCSKPATAQSSASSKTVNTAKKISTNEPAEQWYQAKAKPVLVVRDGPSVTAAKLGTIPESGKVKVLVSNVKPDSISGHSGAWVKIEWLDKTGYVFDGFLSKL
jgi:hypothetical protein